MLERSAESVGGHTGTSLFDYARLEPVASELRAEFERAAPWQHVVIDGILSDDVARRAASVYPPLDAASRWLAILFERRSFDGRLEECDPLLVDIFKELQSKRFITFVEDVTGIAALEPDQDLIGAGLHQGSRGSYLRVHADHNTHQKNPTRYRRINVLIYLNDGWQPDWNGDLELWDREAKGCRKRIAPAFNRCVILRVDDNAYHGYGPLRTPPDVTRKALAVYYYSPTRDELQDTDPHQTIWPELDGEHRLAAFSHRVRRSILSRLTRALRSIRRSGPSSMDAG